MPEDVFGNAYLGRYLGSLGLGDAAVQFITKAAPDQMIFLTTETAKRFKIDFEGSLPLQAVMDEGKDKHDRGKTLRVKCVPWRGVRDVVARPHDNGAGSSGLSNGRNALLDTLCNCVASLHSSGICVGQLRWRMLLV